MTYYLNDDRFKGKIALAEDGAFISCAPGENGNVAKIRIGTGDPFVSGDYFEIQISTVYSLKSFIDKLTELYSMEVDRKAQFVALMMSMQRCDSPLDAAAQELGRVTVADSASIAGD